jgi:carboxylesterase type B
MDELYVKYQPIYSLLRGNFSKIPLIIGTNTDEGTLFTVETIKSSEHVQNYYKEMIPFVDGPEKKTLQQLYPLQSYKEPYLAAADFTGDYLFHCPSLLLARIYSNQNVKVFKYRWNHEFTLARLVLQRGNSSLGVFHFSEVPFVFNIGWMQMSRQEAQLGRLVNRMWTKFVESGNPNFEETEFEWPFYRKTTLYQQIVFQLPLDTIYVERDTDRNQKCKFYDKVGSENIFRDSLVDHSEDD